MMASWNSAN